jgi:hypothetical protein
MSPILSAPDKRQAIEKLKERLGSASLVQREVRASAFVRGGIARGAVTEFHGVSGSGKTELAVQILAEHPEEPVAWIEGGESFFPAALPFYQINMERLLFVQAGDDVEWAALQVLKSGLFPIVIVSFHSLKAPLRRLQVCAEHIKATVLLLGQEPHCEDRWALASSIEVQRSLRLYSPDPIRLTYSRKQESWNKAVNE